MVGVDWCSAFRKVYESIVPGQDETIVTRHCLPSDTDEVLRMGFTNKSGYQTSMFNFTPMKLEIYFEQDDEQKHSWNVAVKKKNFLFDHCILCETLCTNRM